MRVEEEMAERASRANSLASEFNKRGGVPKAERVDPVQSRFVSAGGFHSAVVDDEGLAWVWGRSAEGQLGLGDGPAARGDDVLAPKLVPLENLKGKHVTQVVCGVNITAAIDEDGALWTWGHGKGYLGHEDIYVPGEEAPFDVKVPRRILRLRLDDVYVHSVSLGWSHAVVGRCRPTV
jgi:hypothetical protein